MDKIDKWVGPNKDAVSQTVKVTYTYKIKDLASWAKKPEVQAVFPGLKNFIDGAGTEKQEQMLRVTNKGWEAE